MTDERAKEVVAALRTLGAPTTLPPTFDLHAAEQACRDAADELERLRRHLGNLCARIHRDGGQRQAERPVDEVVTECDTIVATAYRDMADQDAEIARLREALKPFAAIAGEPRARVNVCVMVPVELLQRAAEVLK